MTSQLSAPRFLGQTAMSCPYSWWHRHIQFQIVDRRTQRSLPLRGVRTSRDDRRAKSNRACRNKERIGSSLSGVCYESACGLAYWHLADLGVLANVRFIKVAKRTWVEVRVSTRRPCATEPNNAIFQRMNQYIGNLPPMAGAFLTMRHRHTQRGKEERTAAL
jgi:hypothetical protein